MEKREIRIIPDDDSEVRVIGNSRNIEGHGIVFNKESKDLGGFREVILPGAVEGILDKSDILALLNHDQSRGLLARSTNGKGSLKLSIDKKGLKYAFEAPSTALGDELIEGIKRGDIRTSSFAFALAPEGDKWEKRDDGTYLRTVNKFAAIYDVSAVYREAYEDTDVALRSLDEIRKDEIIEIPSTIHGEDLKNTLEHNLETLKTTDQEQRDEPEVKPVIEETVTEPIIERTEPKVTEPVIEQRNINLKYNSMTIAELKDLRAQALEENEQIYTAKNAENRTMTEKEEAQSALNNQKIKEYDLQIETESRKEGKGVFVGGGPYIQMGRDKEKFSLIKAIRAEVDHKPLSEAAAEIASMGKEQFRSQAGQTPKGFMSIPNFEQAVIGRKELRANILAQTATQGQEIVAEDKKAILPPLVDRLIFSQAGVTYMPGLVGDVSIPAYAGTTVAWKDEVETAADGGGAFSEVTFAPKKLTGYLDVSKTFLAQDGVGAERLLLDNIANAVARKLEATILGPATLSSKTPSGIGYKLNVANGGGVAKLTGASITFAAMVGLETTVSVLNADQGNLAYITNGTARGILKVIDKGTSNDTGDYILMDNQMNGYPVLVTNAIPSTYGSAGSGNLVTFGNWGDLCIAQWGGYDITVDPYTLAVTNQVRIVINCYFDAKGLRGSTGSNTTLDEYAYSFSALSIS